MKKTNFLLILYAVLTFVALGAILIFLMATSSKVTVKSPGLEESSAVATSEPTASNIPTATPVIEPTQTPPQEGIIFTFDGTDYYLGCPYADFISAGWEIDYNYYGITESEQIKGNSWEPNNTLMKSETFSVYSGTSVCIGLINETSENKAYKDCTIWSFGVDADTAVTFGDKYPAFSFKGLSIGDAASKMTEIFGSEYADVYTGEGYKEYTYSLTEGDKNYSVTIGTKDSKECVFSIMVTMEQ